MFYYALIDGNNICTAVYAMPAEISGASYIAITQEQYTSQSVIGMKYANGEWIEVSVYRYAILNEKDIVINVYESEAEMPSADNLVEITEAQYNDSSLVGMWYDREDGTFKVAPISVLADMSTSQIQYKAEEKWLDTKMDEVDTALANRYTKEESDAKYALAGSTGGATMTAQEVLNAVKSLDGEESGLDADMLDGKHSSDFALATELASKANADHTHDGYANATHTHEEYANATHTHAQSDITGLTDALAGKSDTSHTHSGYANSTHTHAQSEIAGLTSALAGKSDTTHTHSGYANSSHTHSQSDITGLSTALAGKANSNHSHSGYASSSHTHSEYFEKSGGTITGETNFSGGLVRLIGTQTLFNSGSMITFGSNNMPTNIAGNAITSTKTITVSSDLRLKEDVKPLDKQRLLEFMRQIEFVSYRYHDENEDTKRIGVIAQQLLDVDPEMARFFVRQDEEGYYSVDYTALSLLALLAIQ